MALTAITIALAMRKQPDHSHAIGEEIEPSVPSLT
jgi:hypothetical protein